MSNMELKLCLEKGIKQGERQESFFSLEKKIDYKIYNSCTNEYIRDEYYIEATTFGMVTEILLFFAILIFLIFLLHKGSNANDKSV